ncbi:hypothetical protein FBQ96_10705 [Nitrospirales bacterium NOB]|nr:hypothetical protein [Nitrospirales bacterium NOB]
MLVFYSGSQIPFAFVEVGRIYLKNINYWADRDPGAQTEKIISEAAAHGADGVIIQGQLRYESSSMFFAQGWYAGAGSNAGQVYQMSGIAIVKKQ